MKYIYILLILFCFNTSYSQTLRLRSNGAFTEQDKFLNVYGALSIPHGASNTFNGGLALIGSIFFNTTDQKMYIYNGTSWEQAGNGDLQKSYDNSISGSIDLNNTKNFTINRSNGDNLFRINDNNRQVIIGKQNSLPFPIFGDRAFTVNDNRGISMGEEGAGSIPYIWDNSGLIMRFYRRDNPTNGLQMFPTTPTRWSIGGIGTTSIEFSASENLFLSSPEGGVGSTRFGVRSDGAATTGGWNVFGTATGQISPVIDIRSPGNGLLNTIGGNGYPVGSIFSIMPDGLIRTTNTIRIEGGSPAAGKVLTSDVNGLASWQTSTVTLANGGAITSNNTNIGYNPNTTSVADWINKVFYDTQPPLAVLTGGQNIELASAGASLPFTLNWTATRQSATANLSTIVVAGVNQTFTNPAQGASVNGTQSVNVARNTNTTFSNVVTTIDGKTATATTTFTFLPRRYWGYSASPTPTQSDILTALGGGFEFATTRAKGSFSINVGANNQYIFYAYPSSFLDLTSLVVGGFESLGAFNKQTQASFTNASGYVQSYTIYVSNSPINAGLVSGIIAN